MLRAEKKSGEHWIQFNRWVMQNIELLPRRIYRVLGESPQRDSRWCA
jgi:hypothetical protein